MFNGTGIIYVNNFKKTVKFPPFFKGCTRVADSVKVLRKENENCCSNGGRVRTLLLDVTSQKSVDSALEFVEKELDGQKGIGLHFNPSKIPIYNI